MKIAGVKLIFFGVVCFLVRNLNALPSGEERWKNPCGNTAQISNNYNIFTIPTQSPLYIIPNMLIRIREGLRLSRGYLDKIANERIKNIKYREYLDSINKTTKEGFLVANKITEEEIKNALKNVTKTHLESYRHLSVATVFIEQMKYDEEIYEHKENSKDIEHLESKVFDVLCYISQAISNLGVSIEYVTRDVMQMNLRSIASIMRRYSRDYIMVKYTTNVLDNLFDIYNRAKKN